MLIIKNELKSISNSTAQLSVFGFFFFLQNSVMTISSQILYNVKYSK